MRIPHFLWLAVLTSLVIANSVAVAQPGKRPSGSRPGSDGSSTLNRAGLKVGMKMPGVKVFDEQGKEFNTASLKGNYTVLTFGCLT